MLQKKNDLALGELVSNKVNKNGDNMTGHLKLGTANVYANSLFTGTKETWNDTNPGTYIGADGTVHMYGKTPSISLHKNTTETLAKGIVYNVLDISYYNAANSVQYTAIPLGIIGNDGTDGYNSGVALGSHNGTTWIGAGEGWRNLIGTLGLYNDESLYLAADGDIGFYTNVANDASSYVNVVNFNNTGMALGTDKQIKRTGHSVSWVSGRDGAILRQTSYTGYNPVWSAKTTNGSWEMGPYTSNILYFNYLSDSYYNAGTNSPIQVRFESNGKCYSAGWATSSSREVKQDISPYQEDPIEALKKINVVNYRYKNQVALEGDDAENRVGFIAEDTDELFAGKAHDAMDMANCIGVLIAAIQKLQEEIDELKMSK